MRALVFADYNHNPEILDKLLVKSILKNINVILFAGNVVTGKERMAEWNDAIHAGRRPNRNQDSILKEIEQDLENYQMFYEKLLKTSLPVMLIPGKYDSPEKKYLSFIDYFEKTDNLHLIHRNLVARDGYIYMGFGGEIFPDEKELENYFVLQYSVETVKYSLRKIKYRAGSKILLFHSSPQNKEEWSDEISDAAMGGITTLKTIINEINPVLAVSASSDGGEQYKRLINEGRGLFVQPGKLSDGNYAVVTLENKRVKFNTL